MSKQRVLALLASLLVVALGTFLVFRYVKAADSRAVANQETVVVYTAVATVPAGTTLREANTAGMIQKERFVAKGVPAQAIKSIDAENGVLVALSDINPGEILTLPRFGDTPTGTKAIQVPPGKVAVSVSLSDPGRVGSFVTPGSYLVVYDTKRSKANKRATSVLLPKALVIGIGSTSLDRQDQAAQGGVVAPADGFLVTFALSPKDAARLIHANTRPEHGENDLYAGLLGAKTKLKTGSGVAEDDLYPGAS